MTRIVSVWLPAWPIERLRRYRGREDVPSDRALALVASGAHGLEIIAANEAARDLGVRVGAGLADTRAALPSLITLSADPPGDWAGLLSLVRWCGRYGPARHVDGANGIWIDITGVAHLFTAPTPANLEGQNNETVCDPSEAGERALLIDLVERFSRFGFTARAGLADTLGAAHAVARFATSRTSPFVIIPRGHAASALASLPVAALRLEDNSVRLLERLGLRYIGQLYDIPRGALERRFRTLGSKRDKGVTKIAATLVRRLDQALGTLPEPRAPLVEAPDFAVRLPFSDPLLTAGGIEAALAQLCRELADTLEQAGVGGRRFRLALYRTDGTLGEVAIGTSKPCRDDEHIRRLLSEKITNFDAGFGIDLMILGAGEVARLDIVQQGLDAVFSRSISTDRLVDRLSSRLGKARITRLLPQARHTPEAAQKHAPALACPPASLSAQTASLASSFDGSRRRPAFLLDPPEPITVLAAVPEGAPVQITWRRLRRRIVRAEGPERIAPPWWENHALPSAHSAATALTRDYYVVEEAAGARYWVFRVGLYSGETDSEDNEIDPLRLSPPCWFMHGVLP